ncbi:MAG: tRNA (adenosine(37)-N6)-threonylcarbamoyltransferase complex dimerization subunit type 1 TsaB [Pedosphaera sp.]|nr:tRNA (adenosine(37)-N6)-threonylcarbamoyltransferase complex dimerization subunit type 1 TsaB [Pedosphaera sp.]
MKILAFEFSSPQRSVAVLHADADGRAVAAREAIDSAPGYGMKPLGMVEEVLRQAGIEREQIECIAIGLGPGSYTGIRAAIALAQGWLLGREVKLIGVSSAECVAAQAQAEGLRGSANVVIDAQRGEFYQAGFELNETGAREVSPLRIVSADEVRACADGNLIGPEVTKWFPNGRVIFPRAAMLTRLAATRADFVAGEKIEPIYLRETAFVKAPPSRVLPPG